MGEVYHAEHRMLRRPVAVKLITPAQAGSPDAIARFEREAQATAGLTHPNTVQIFDYGRSDDGTFCCVMEYLPGDTLEAIVDRDGPMSAARAVHVLTQVCGALAEAHAKGLVHRDIKPSNVMMTDHAFSDYSTAQPSTDTEHLPVRTTGHREINVRAAVLPRRPRAGPAFWARGPHAGDRTGSPS